MKPIFDQEGYKIWMGLSEEKKRQFLSQAFAFLTETAQKELDYIREWKETPSNDKQVGHIYVFNTIELFWGNIALVLFLGESKFANFVSYSARTCVETFLQFFYFCKQNQNRRDETVIKELLRSALKHYQIEKESGNGGAFYAEFYNMCTNNFLLPQIDKVKDEQLRCFPRIKPLCGEYNSLQQKSLYFIYQYLCEDAHGTILANVIRKQSDDFEQFRRSLMEIYMFCKDMLVLGDKEFLNSQFKTEVLDAAKSADNILYNSIRNP